MALLLTARDTAPLFERPELIERGFEAIASSLRSPGTREPAAWLAYPLADGHNRLNVNALTGSHDGTALRLWPTERQGAGDRSLSLLFDHAEGRLLALVAGASMLWRTAGPVLLACRHLAPPDARTLAILGSGGQARQHLIGLRQALPALERLRVYSPTRAHREAFAEEAARATGLPVEAAGDAESAVRGADVVCNTAGTMAPVLDPAWVAPGALVTDIFLGVPRDWPGRVIVPGDAIPVGSSAWAPHPEANGIAMPAPGATLAEVLRGEAPARRTPDERVLYLQLGLYPWDAALLSLAYRWALETGVGQLLPGV